MKDNLNQEILLELPLTTDNKVPAEVMAACIKDILPDYGYDFTKESKYNYDNTLTPYGIYIVWIDIDKTSRYGLFLMMGLDGKFHTLMLKKVFKGIENEKQ